MVDFKKHLRSKAPVIKAFDGSDKTGLSEFETTGQVVIEVDGVKKLYLQVEFDGSIKVTMYGINNYIRPMAGNQIGLITESEPK